MASESSSRPGRQAPASSAMRGHHRAHHPMLPHGRWHWPRADTSLDHVILVDALDRAIGTMPKLDAHRQGRRHRAISVIVRDLHGRLLLHRRADGKYHSAGLWTNTCCSHPRPGEGCSDAAARRLTEEMGIVAPLTPLFSMSYRARVSEHLIEHEIVHVFGATFDGMPDPDPFEVSEWRWNAFFEVIRDVDERPRAYTFWFRKMLREFDADIARFVANWDALPRSGT